MEASRRGKIEKKHFKFGQMWRFCSLFSLIAMACCIMNSWHKVVRSIRNTTLKLWADCAKQFVRNAQNCRKAQGFCTMKHTSSHIVSCAWVFGQKQNRYHASTNIFTGLGHRFPKLKTPMKGKHFATIKEVKENRNRSCWRYQKEVFLGLEKTLA